MSERCPFCGRPCSKVLTIESGDDHRDVWGTSPHSLLGKYVRVCSDPEQSAAALRSAHQPITVVFHTDADLRQS